MQDDAFEWDDDKAARNLAKHRLSFEVARLVFTDPLALEELDRSEDYGEERSIRIGMAAGRLIAVVYTRRESRIRIITARKADKHEQDDYFVQNQ